MKWGKVANNIQGNSIRLPADSSAETLQARREWANILKVMTRKKNLSSRILYVTRPSFRFDVETNSFTDGLPW